MPKLIAIARLLLSPLLLILSACGTDGTTFSNRIGNNGHDVLYSKAQVKDGVARFECKASDSGLCHYTLYPDACAGKPDCALAPLQHFTVARGQTRQIAGLRDFRVCVGIDGKPMRADCQPVVQR
ncbi:hypothetical protein [Thermomonas sp. HDW16]|uniref:hypothetical protein n=1 Tax=Thermomonas sp. HDW16 TaxID=2714945 RepID=UPI00140ADA6F|nr:hypothetical protein [Thermomonas sp. HDW16]QIL19710.1 hypothetical protein G7079_02625 [Thermomonas sp. HDW16]